MIREATREDEKQLEEFFNYAITDTFVKEGVGHLIEDIKNEINYKMLTFEESLNNKAILFVSIFDEKIVATGAIIECSNLISDHSPELASLKELGAVFVDPNFQKQGLGTEIVDALIKKMNNMNETEFCLDSGYTIAKGIWRKKFGPPYNIVKDLWGEGHDHYIWKLSI